MIAWKPHLYDSNIASARLRCFLPCDHLRHAGWRCEIFQESHQSEYRLVIFQKAYSLEDIALARRLKEKGCKAVFDLCDNHFYQPLDYEKNGEERVERLHEMIGLADLVSVTTPQLASLLPRKKCVVIDDALDEYPDGDLHWGERIARFRRSLSRRVPLVWFGNAGTKDPPSGLANLGALIPELNRFNRTKRISLSVISNSRPLFNHHLRAAEFPVRYCEWRRKTFRPLVRQHRVCLLPVAQNAFTICKTNNRLLLPLLFGVPVVADKIPSYEELSPYVLFSDWGKNLAAYVENPELARRHVSGAQEYIRRNYTPARVVSQWAGLFAQLLSPNQGVGNAGAQESTPSISALQAL